MRQHLGEMFRKVASHKACLIEEGHLMADHVHMLLSIPPKYAVSQVSVTPANVADVTELPNLLREDDRAVFGDAGYVNDHYKRAARRVGVYWGVALKAHPKSRLGSGQKQRNRKHSSIRSRVEHVFRVIKCQFGYTKVRYQGLAKNAALAFMLVGLANLYLKRKELLA